MCPTDILVYNWYETKHVCVGITRASPILGFSKRIFEVGHIAISTTLAMEEKHSRACKATQHGFANFAFDAFRFRTPEAIKLLKRICKVMDHNVMTAGLNEYVFKRIGFVIQKGLAVQFVVHLSSTFV